MATTPTPPGTTASTVLTVLQGAGGYITLGLQLAGVFVPIVKGLIAKIEGIGTGNVTIAFTDLVAADTAELDAITNLSTDDLTSINAELSRLLTMVSRAVIFPDRMALPVVSPFGSIARFDTTGTSASEK